MKKLTPDLHENPKITKFNSKPNFYPYNIDVYNKVGIGNYGEQLACEYLLSKNYKILQRKFRSIFGEIDIIAQDKDELVFVEVKRRRSIKYGYPEEAIGKIKIGRIIKTIGWFFIKFPNCSNKKYRIDAISIIDQEGNNLFKHYKNVS